MKLKLLLLCVSLLVVAVGIKKHNSDEISNSPENSIQTKKLAEKYEGKWDEVRRDLDVVLNKTKRLKHYQAKQVASNF
ncbi:MAG: hypothetical protein KC493_07600 [Bacteriovoracaceae bacterium]|nr:hypothetical protein [Bacteriovoracaceae bacterium]